MGQDDTDERVSILIDRELTLEFGGRAGIVARFDESIPLLRVIDGDELVAVSQMGRFEGGMFATASERRWGASWATIDAQDLLEWGQSWAERGRLGEDLFLVKADGEGHVFYHENGRSEIDFDPNGPLMQPASMPLSLCSTGLGCSVVVSMDDVDIYRPTKGGNMRKMSAAAVRKYVRDHRLPEVVLRNFGFGTNYYAGLILGVSVIVGEDQHDKLWSVQDRNDRFFVRGAWSKDAAVAEAAQAIDDGTYATEVIWLSDPPDGFEEVEVGDEYRLVSGLDRGWKGNVSTIGSSYVVLYGRAPRRDYNESRHVDADALMSSRWELV